MPHLALTIGETAFTFQRKPESIAAEAALDGLYIIRTSVAAVQMDAATPNPKQQRAIELLRQIQL